MKKLIGSAIEFNSSSVAYISVPLKDVMFLTLLNITANSCCASIPLWLNKMQR